MTRTYNVIDADGHILEPFSLWNEYLDPAFRDRAPRLIKDNTGKQRLLLDEKLLGSRAGFGGIGGVGARQGVVAAESMDYEDGRKGGFDPHRMAADCYGEFQPQDAHDKSKNRRVEIVIARLPETAISEVKAPAAEPEKHEKKAATKSSSAAHGKRR